jgi:hypothetical protein
VTVMASYKEGMRKAALEIHRKERELWSWNKTTDLMVQDKEQTLENVTSPGYLKLCEMAGKDPLSPRTVKKELAEWKASKERALAHWHGAMQTRDILRAVIWESFPSLGRELKRELGHRWEKEED